MKLIDNDLLLIQSRQRTEMDPTKVGELEESITEVGLLHPPVVYLDKETSQYILVAGERRITAIRNLLGRNQGFMCGLTFVRKSDPQLIPVTNISELEPAVLLQAEFDENHVREPIHWKDRVRALNKIHELKKKENPRQTLTKTAEELIERTRESGAAVAGATTMGSVRAKLSESVQLAKHLDNPLVATARTADAARQILLKQQEDRIRAEFARRANLGSKDSDIELRNGDMLKIMPNLDPGQFDLILCDPPYGININQGGINDDSLTPHGYDDSPVLARDILLSLFHDGFRVTKNRANLLVFLDPDNWSFAKEAAGKAGWTVFRTPLIWRKSSNEGMAPWRNAGPRRTYEMILFATKGQKGLLLSMPDVLDFKRVETNVKTHGAEKPQDLLRSLIQHSSLPGDSILDPCAGSASTLVAARALARKALGFEISEEYYQTGLANLHRASEEAPLVTKVHA